MSPAAAAPGPHIWVRAEDRGTEQRSPLVPADARRLVEAGFDVTVEESPFRVFPVADYAAAGATIVPAGSWVDAPDEVFVVGIKELPDEPDVLRHRHVYFAHAFKGQSGADRTLERFERGGRGLLDVEYLTDADGRRVVAFGYWAGYVGAALGVLRLRGMLPGRVAPMERSALDASLRESGRVAAAHGTDSERALVTGALGRSGRGACDALAVAGMTPTRWDLAETRDLDVEELLEHDLLVNCVVASGRVTPFVTDGDLDGPHRLRVVADVTCDVTSEANMLPINHAVTSWDAPARRVRADDPPPVEVIAIDNLPSLLPREASEAFSADLTPQLLALADGGDERGVWEAARTAYRHAVERRTR